MQSHRVMYTIKRTQNKKGQVIKQKYSHML